MTETEEQAIRQLPEQFKRSGFIFYEKARIVHGDFRVVLLMQVPETKDVVKNFVVIMPKLSKPHPRAREPTYDLTEVFPSERFEWGTRGWTFMTEEDAFDKLLDLYGEHLAVRE